MDTTDLLNNDLQVSPTVQSHLSETAKWGKFLSILGFIMCGMMIIFAFVIPDLITNLPTYNGFSEGTLGAAKGLLIAVYLILAALFFFPCLFLYRFSVKTQASLRTTNQETFEDGFRNLKSTFRFYGIMAIVILSFYAIIIIAGIAGAAMR